MSHALVFWRAAADLRFWQCDQWNSPVACRTVPGAMPRSSDSSRWTSTGRLVSVLLCKLYARPHEAAGLRYGTTACHWPAAGPCYRCLYPVAPRADACSRCSDAGVLGPVPGFIGCLQVSQIM